jgi:hypothetical protein
MLFVLSAVKAIRSDRIYQWLASLNEFMLALQFIIKVKKKYNNYLHIQIFFNFNGRGKKINSAKKSISDNAFKVLLCELRI